MTKTEKLSHFIDLRNGYLSIADVQALGISRTYVREYIAANGLERVAHGVYKSPEVFTDDLYILALKNKKAIYSFDTALMLNGLTEREPAEIFVTVPRAYNASHLRGMGVIVNYVRDEWAELGKTVVKTTYGNEVSVYDRERTICDILRVRKKKDPQMFAYAIKEYAKNVNKNLPKLARYAKELGVETELRRYMEVLL